ncbi:hypothetical protein [Streptomyces sp. CA-179760]|uniref:hypothetical protein n=1 Tax=Streptomyces sp. CA-179760 TaxID=3240054 RepID=UPI003D90EB80
MHRARPGPADRTDLRQPARFGRRHTGRAAQAHDGRVVERRVPQRHVRGEQPVADVQAEALRGRDASRPCQRLHDAAHGRVGVGVEVDVERITLPIDHGQHQRHETSSSQRVHGGAAGRARQLSRH